ncbi:MAG: efflux RND transporter permease subunit [Terracidiphilus sp.]
MHLSAPFIRRPVATSLLSLALLLAGAVAYSVLPVASLPDVDYPVIGVSAGLPGASPETMASAVATPLERQFGRIAGVNEMTSTSTLGSASVVLQFDMSRNIDDAARDVQAAINSARGQLPSYLPQNPSYRKANPSDAPILILTLTSDVVPKPQIYDMADSILAQRISEIDGVGQVFVGGSASPAVRVELNPLQLANAGIGLEAIRTALSNANANRPKGSFQDAAHRWMITDNDQIFKASDYAPIIAGYNQTTGAPVRVEDVGTVTDSVADIHTDGVSGINPDKGPPAKLRGAVLIIVYKIPGANVISTVDNVMKELPQLQGAIPPTIKISVAQDRTTTIRSGVRDVEISLAISVLLVVLVVFLFLREVWATIIPSVAVPLSLVGTFGVMYLLGYSVDNLSLMALTISTGFVVDDAIVVIENITRYLEMGMKPFDAAMKGSKEIGFTVISMSTSLIAVFIPILLMGGIVGKLFREFAVTLSVAIAVSLLVSLTTTPMLCAKFLRPHGEIAHGHAYRMSERAFEWLHEEYATGLRWVLRHQWLMLGVLLGTMALNVYLYKIVPKGFFPEQDTGRIGGQTIAAQNISFTAMRVKQRELGQMVLDDPAISSVTAFAGGGRNSNNVGFMFVSLKDVNKRPGRVSSDDVVNRLRRKLSSVPGAQLFLHSFQDIHIGGHGGAAEYTYTLSDPNLEELNHWAPLLQARMRGIPELRDVSTDEQDQGLAEQLVINRDTASRLGVTASAIDQTLYDAFGQREVSTMYTGLNQYYVVMEVDPKYQQDPDALNGIYIKSSTGQMVPLSTIAHFESQRTSLTVNHQGQYPSVSLSFNLAPSVSLGQAVTAIERAEMQMGMPSALRASFSGTAQAFQQSLSSEPYLVLAAVVAVFIVLGILYESLIHPLTILSTLPPAGVGAFLALLITGTSFTIISMIGILLLIGIVKKNAILMIDFALQAERDMGLAPVEAIYKACLLRFRPIMMTTMAAMFGGLPLAIGLGVGSELRKPLGITIVGGLIVSQMLTLFTTPVVYLFFDRLQWRFMKLHRIGAELEGQHGD